MRKKKGRYSGLFMVLLAFDVLSVHADDSWLSKSPAQWTQQDCQKILGDSPWAMKKEVILSSIVSTSPTPDYSHTNGGTMQSEPPKISSVSLDYLIRVTSALPIREAGLRARELYRLADKPNDAPNRFVEDEDLPTSNPTYDNRIVFHIIFSLGGSGNKMGNQEDKRLIGTVAAFFGATMEDASNLDMALVTESRERIRPYQFHTAKNGANHFYVSFPRMHNGQPVLKTGEKSFTLEFQSPPVGSTHAKKIEAKFSLDKMNFDGKVAY